LTTVTDTPLELRTSRLRLRCWQEADRDAFAHMNADPVVMDDLGGPISRVASDQKFDRYIDAFRTHGFGRLLVERAGTHGESEFLGYTGVMPFRAPHPLGDHDEIGWRFRREVWGNGYATEAAQAALADVFKRIGLAEVLSYTAPDNLRSQAVVARLGLRRDTARDFDHGYEGTGSWTGLVWIATNPEPPTGRN
jgi:RimJ/RimL family protein N-acetyltransferase